MGHATLARPGLRARRLARACSGLALLLLVLLSVSACAPKPSAVTELPPSTSATVSGSTSAVATTTPPPPTTPTVKTTTPAKPVAPAVGPDVTKQPTLITKLKQLPSTKWQGTFDYVQFLTGSAALKAAKAHGDTVDNDYYVVNDNKKLRTFPISSGVVIQLHPGSGPTYSRYFSVDEFKTLMEDGTATYGGKYYTGNGMYYIDVKNGQVTRIETLWVP